MATTTTIVDDNLELLSGVDRNDPVVLKRWVRAVQRSARLIYNDRQWRFKLVTDTGFSYNPAGAVSLPSDFGSVFAQGAGVYAQSPVAALKPMDYAELIQKRRGTSTAAAAISQYTRYSIGPTTLELFPQLLATTTITLVYLRRNLNCVYFETASDLDELSWIPTEWHQLVSDGAAWMHAHEPIATTEEAEKAFLTLGLQNMRDREDWGQRFSSMVPAPNSPAAAPAVTPAP